VEKRITITIIVAFGVRGYVKDSIKIVSVIGKKRYKPTT